MPEATVQPRRGLPGHGASGSTDLSRRARKGSPSSPGPKRRHLLAEPRLLLESRQPTETLMARQVAVDEAVESGGIVDCAGQR
jgi:hypothetical protein